MPIKPRRFKRNRRTTSHTHPGCTHGRFLRLMCFFSLWVKQNRALPEPRRKKQTVAGKDSDDRRQRGFELKRSSNFC